MDENRASRAGKQLLGTDYATIDGKGRVLIAKKKRERLGEGFAVTIGELGCLTLYPGETWDDLVEEIYRYEATSEDRKEYMRLFLANADDGLNFDDQGRFVIPRNLRTLAGLKEDMDVTILGCGDRLEIWSTEEYAKYEEDRAGYSLGRRQLFNRARSGMKAG